MDLFDAIYKRKSIRKYCPEGLPSNIHDNITTQIAQLSKLYDNIDLKIHLVKEGEKIQKISTGIIGSYGKINGPHYLVATSDQEEGYLENTGYALEKIVLQLTTMGIGTCWIGGYVKKQLLKDIITIAPSHQPVIVVSFGYAEAGIETVRNPSAGIKRKDLHELVTGQMDETWTKIIDAVRMSPSGINLQPWRFVFDKGVIHIYTVKRGFITAWRLEPMNRIDAGIALAHLEIAARHFNKEVRFEKVASALRNDLNYITSVFEK